MQHTSKLLLLLLLLSVPFVMDARADTVAVTGGSVMTGNINGGPFTLIGSNFVLNGGLNFANPQACSPCRPGQVLNFGAFNVGLDVRSGSGTVNGVNYSQLFYDAALSLAGSVTIPSNDAASLTLSAPFTFTGTMNVCTTSTVASGCQGGYIFSSQLVGQGIATIMLNSFLDPTLGRLYSINSVTYNFSPQPIPEPTTLLLLGTGLASVAGAARRRRRGAADNSDAS